MPLDPGSRLDSVPSPSLRSVTVAAGAAFVAMTVPMQLWERRMRATGGPGIVRLQFAGEPSTAYSLLDRWGPAGRRAARQQTWADFAYLKTYAYAGVCGAELLRRRTSPGTRWDRSGRVVRWLPVIAATFDAAENVLLLRTLAASERGEPLDAAALRVTRAAAGTKFTLLLGSICWAVGAATIGTRSNRGR
ncbi:hypothetical protein GA707_11610 [Nostocoides sp. F2B08]|uniref:hypothetical protein n=1 Tax=Nostocoides sp. F2B08 TaxID=2653936 RepID=UPI001262DACF|nr:hypothetical protein [Tetrasphaera sp. F2B08]KAB7744093.1 hypothetical protein GA707_11610 [Tetrasphaera sp. F2B08]